MRKSIKHDPVQRDIYVTSKHRTLGGVEWFREAQFSKDDAASSQQINNTWAVLAKISKATAPAAVDRPKRHTLIPDFGKMESHEDVMNREILKAVDDRPPLHPKYDDRFKPVVKMVKPKKSAEQLEREAREKRKLEAEKRKEQSSEFGIWKKRQQHHAMMSDDDGDGDFMGGGGNMDGEEGVDFHYVIEETTDENGNTVKRKVKKKGKAKNGSGRDSPLKFLLKERPDPKQIHAPVLNRAERFADHSSTNKSIMNNNNISPQRRKKNALLAAEAKRKRKEFNSNRNNHTRRRNPDRLSDFLGSSSNTNSDEDGENDMIRDEEERKRQAKREFETLTHKFEGGNNNNTKDHQTSSSAAKFAEYDYVKDPDGVGRIVDFSSKPFKAAPCWSFGTPSSGGESAVQRKKRQEEEQRAAEVEYSINARHEKHHHGNLSLSSGGGDSSNVNNSNTSGVSNSNNNNSSFISNASPSSSSSASRLGAAIDFSRYSSRETGAERRTSRKDEFLKLFRNRDAKMNGPGSPFFHHSRARTPELNSGCLLGSGGTNGSAIDKAGSSSSAPQHLSRNISELAKNAEASAIRSSHARKLYKAASRSLIKRAISATPENLMRRNSPNNGESNNNSVKRNQNNSTSNSSEPAWQSLARRSPFYNLILHRDIPTPSSSASASKQQQIDGNHDISAVISNSQNNASSQFSSKPPLPDKRLHFSASGQNFEGDDGDYEDDEEF